MKGSPAIPRDIITPEDVFMSRRNFARAGIAAASLLATGLAYKGFFKRPTEIKETPLLSDLLGATAAAPTQEENEENGFFVNETRTPFKSVAGYNNFYEFTTDKEAVAEKAANFDTTGWKIEVGGLCSKPRTFDMDQILKIAALEERVYRMRCVEAWSMVIPWNGYSLSRLLEKVQPKIDAKYVAFETLVDPKRMPGQRGGALDWPYVEGLRMDEAMHPLTMLATGVYGRAMPGQNGAPVRLVVPWKYGFKGIKSIVKITLTDKEPPTTWNLSAPGEYGFFANVNPEVDHPRWSQATENRIGEGRRPTLPFNGYGEHVASLYEGLDLRKNF